VRRYPPGRDTDADRGELPVVHPDSRKTLLSPGRYPKVAQRQDQYLFEISQIAVQVAAIRLEIEDRISHELTRAVICHIATTTRRENFDAPVCQFVRGQKDVLRMGTRPERDDVRMLKQENGIRDFAIAPPLNQVGLKLDTGTIGDNAKTLNIQSSRHVGSAAEKWGPGNGAHVTRRVIPQAL
jgi:hypothetical protein